MNFSKQIFTPLEIQLKNNFVSKIIFLRYAQQFQNRLGGYKLNCHYPITRFLTGFTPIKRLNLVHEVQPRKISYQAAVAVLVFGFYFIFSASLAEARKTSLQLNRSSATDCKDVRITSRGDLGGDTNNINIFKVENGENIGTQLFDLVRQPPHNVCADFGFSTGEEDRPINSLGAGTYAVVEHGEPYSGECDGQDSPRALNYNACKRSANFVSEARFTISKELSVSQNVENVRIAVTRKSNSLYAIGAVIIGVAAWFWVRRKK